MDLIERIDTLLEGKSTLDLDKATKSQLKKLKEGDKVSFKATDGVVSVDTVYDIWKEKNDTVLVIELKQNESTLRFKI